MNKLVTSFRLSRQPAAEAGKEQPEADVVGCTSMGKNVENHRPVLREGHARSSLRGACRNNDYTDKDNVTKHYAMQVMIQQAEFADSKRDAAPHDPPVGQDGVGGQGYYQQPANARSRGTSRQGNSSRRHGISSRPSRPRRASTSSLVPASALRAGRRQPRATVILDASTAAARPPLSEETRWDSYCQLLRRPSGFRSSSTRGIACSAASSRSNTLTMTAQWHPAPEPEPATKRLKSSTWTETQCRSTRRGTSDGDAG